MKLKLRTVIDYKVLNVIFLFLVRIPDKIMKEDKEEMLKVKSEVTLVHVKEIMFKNHITKVEVLKH